MRCQHGVSGITQRIGPVQECVAQPNFVRTRRSTRQWVDNGQYRRTCSHSGEKDKENKNEDDDEHVVPAIRKDVWFVFVIKFTNSVHNNT